MCIGSSSTTSSTAVDDPELWLLATIFRSAIGVRVLSSAGWSRHGSNCESVTKRATPPLWPLPNTRICRLWADKYRYRALASPFRVRLIEDASARPSRTGTLVPVYTIHGTKKLLDRVKQRAMPVVEHPSTALGNWYATAIFWRPQAAFFVNETTLLPVLLPLAPATSITARFPEALESILKVLAVNTAFIASERWAMSEASFSKTANRSVLGVMNRLELELDYVRDRVGEDLLDLSVYMSDHLVGPLRGTEFRTPQQRPMEVVRAQARPSPPAPGTEV